MRILKQSIIGLILIIGLTVLVSDARAIYSSTISVRVSVIKQHVLSARQQNGTGTLSAAWEHLAEQDKSQRMQGKATSFPFDAAEAIGKMFRDMFYEIMQAPLDPIYMIFNLISDQGWSVMNAVPNIYISDCLRNDIWALQDLRDIVAQEMIKAYLMADEHNGDLLMDDYDYLTNNIKLLKKYGNRPTEELPYYITITENGASVTRRMESSEYFFGHMSDVNYYSFQLFPEKRKGADEEACRETCNKNCVNQYGCVDETGKCEDEGECEDYCKNRCDSEEAEGVESGKCEDACENACEMQEVCKDACEYRCEEDAKIEWMGCPESDFAEAADEVMQSIENFAVIGSFQGADWGSIWEMAKARARRQANNWIKANQISLTIGGEEGGNPQSLIKGGGLDRFVGSMKTQINILNNMIGPAIPLFTWQLFETTGDAISVGLGLADEKNLTDNYCMYWDKSAGVYRACTVNQFLDYKICVSDKTKAKNKGINCDVFKNPTVNRSALDIVDEYNEAEAENIKTLERARTAFIYHTELNSVGENNIEAIEKILSGINAEIRYTYEAEGESGVTPLPTIYNILGTFAKKHGGGK